MTFGARVAAAIAGIRFRGVVPIVLMAGLILAVGAYTAPQQGAFLTSLNLHNLLLEAMPLMLVSMGQTCVLLVGGFDVSVAALMTLCVVVASYTLADTTSTLGMIPGALLLVGIGLAVGLFNALLILFFRLPSIIATLGTLSILQGISFWLRGFPSGSTSSDVVSALTTSWSFVPLAFIGVVVLALAADVWLYRSRTGLALRAVGLDETSSRRIGIRTTHMAVLAFVACSVFASIAGFYQAAYSPSGSPIVGNQALQSIAAGVLGGASLAGGRGSFFGTLLAALFLSLIGNVLALFHQPTEYADMTIGVLILVALVLYQGPELLARLRTSRGGVGRLRGGGAEAEEVA
jgi:ribose transport system ATP-binding protein